MISKICATVDKNHIYNCTSKAIGRQGENICTQLEITLEDCLCDSWVYLHFEKIDGTTKVTERLEIINNVVTYEIGNDLLDMAGALKVFVELHKDSGLVWKSSTKEYTVLKSFSGTDQIENKEDFITEAQKIVDEANNLDIDVEKVDNTTTLTITKKDGTTEEVQIFDGEGGGGGGTTPLNINIENGTGENSLEQKIESTSWDTTNEAVMHYITEEIGTEDDPNRKIVHDGNTILVGTFGKSSFMQNGKGQTVGGKSHVEGSKCIAFENNSHAEGNETFAGGKHSHSEGNTTSALGNAAHAEGLNTQALGIGSHSEGIRSMAIGVYSHAEGVDTVAENQYSHSEGCGSVASGDTSHAEGHYTQANGVYSHSEGNNTYANNDCSHAEGNDTYANGVYSHSEGYHTYANGSFSHSEGYKTTAEKTGTHAEGVETHANNDCCHSEGYQTRANGLYSHSEGYGTVADKDYCHVQGSFNKIDTNKEFIHIVGNGTSESDRSNAHTIDYLGNAMFAGEIIGYGNMPMATRKNVENAEADMKKYVDDIVGNIESLLSEV